MAKSNKELWLEQYPFGYYNNELDKGTGDEEIKSTKQTFTGWDDDILGMKDCEDVVIVTEPSVVARVADEPTLDYTPEFTDTDDIDDIVDTYRDDTTCSNTECEFDYDYSTPVVPFADEMEFDDTYEVDEPQPDTLLTLLYCGELPEETSAPIKESTKTPSRKYKKVLREGLENNGGWAVYALDNTTNIEYCAGVYDTAQNAHYWASMDKSADGEYRYGDFSYRVERVDDYTKEMADSNYELNKVKLANSDNYEGSIEECSNSSLGEGCTHFKYTSGANPYIAKTDKEAQSVLNRWREHAKFVGNINGNNYYVIDDSTDTPDFENSFAPGDLEEDLDENTFKVGDALEYSGLFGGSYVSVIEKIQGKKMWVDTSWNMEETGEEIHEKDTFFIEKDAQGNDCIIIWVYHGEVGRVYPPKRNASTVNELEESACEYVSTYNGCTIYKCDNKYICNKNRKSLSATSEDELKRKIDSEEKADRDHYYNLPESASYEEDKPYTKSQIRDELKRETRDWTIKGDNIYYGFDSEYRYAITVLKKHYENVTGNDSRMSIKFDTPKKGKGLQEKQLREGTSNFYYENRCVVVTDEDYESGNVPETEKRPVNDNRNFPQYPLVDYNDDLKFHSIVLTPGYYQAACLDFVEVDNDSIYDEYGYICEGECDQIWYDEESDDWVKNGSYGKDDEHLTMEQAISFIKGCLSDYPMVTDEDIKKALEEEKADGYYRISVFLQDEDILGKISSYCADSEVAKCNQIIDTIKKEYGYKEYGVSARFSNGETWYTPLDESKQLNEGPGAGYTIKGNLSINNVNTLSLVDIKKSDSTWTDKQYDVTFDCTAMGKITDLSFDSYMYGDSVDEAEVAIDGVKVSIYLGSGEEVTEEFVNSHLTDIKDALIGCSLKISFVYGGGYMHSTYDGTIGELDEVVKDTDVIYFDNWDAEVFAISANLTDDRLINWIDKVVTGETYTTVYTVYDDNDDAVESFEDESTAIKYAQEQYPDSYSRVEREEFKEYMNGDQDFLDAETVWESEADEEDWDEDEDFDEALSQKGLTEANKKKISLYVNGEYICSSNEYSTCKEFVNKVKADGKVTYQGKKGNGTGSVTKEIKDTDKVTAKFN